MISYSHMWKIELSRTWADPSNQILGDWLTYVPAIRKYDVCIFSSCGVTILYINQYRVECILTSGISRNAGFNNYILTYMNSSSCYEGLAGGPTNLSYLFLYAVSNPNFLTQATGHKSRDIKWHMVHQTTQQMFRENKTSDKTLTFFSEWYVDRNRCYIWFWSETMFESFRAADFRQFKFMRIQLQNYKNTFHSIMRRSFERTRAS